MKHKLSILLTLATLVSALIISGCGTTADQPTEAPTAIIEPTQAPTAVTAPTEDPAGGGAGLPNPASVYCQEQGHNLETRSDADGGQYGVCIFPDGSECEEWSYYRGECSPSGQPVPSGGQPVVGWLGHVLSTAEGAQFDDYLVLASEGTGEFGLTGADAALEAEIVGLRDKEEPGKYANFWGTLTCDVPDYGGCQLVVTRLRYGPTVSDPDPVQGWEGTLVSNPSDAQFDDYFVLAGDFAVRYGIGSAVAESGELELADELASLRDSGTPFRVWGQLLCGVPDVNGCQIQVTQIEVNGEIIAITPLTEFPEDEGAGTEPVTDWAGVIVSNPAGAQFDDYFEWQSFKGGRYGIESLDSEIQARIVELRDTGQTVHVWGTLHRDVPDMNATQIQVTRLEVAEAPAPPEVTEETVDGWVGTMGKYPPGSQLDGYFERDDGQRYGIAALDEGLRQQLEAHRWTGAQVQVWGRLLVGVPDVENRQIQVERIQDVSGPATEARNLSPFATTSASSALPSDRWGTYQAFSAIDGSLSTPWSEGADGPGIGEWIMLTFPGSVEVYSVGLSVGYDRDVDDTFRSPEVFSANNRLKRATFIFSNGEQIQLDFDDTRGVQTIPLVRAPGPSIQTTFVKVVIDDVYPGSRYDDTCLAEIEVWGTTQ